MHQQKLAHWKQVIIDCRTSGLTATEYMRRHGIRKDASYYWLRQIREELLEEHPEYLHQPKPCREAEVTPELAAHVLSQKYALAVPFYRQAAAWKALGLPLSRTNMANWAIGLGRDYFLPLVGQMKASLLASDVLHADETTVQVHKESAKRTQRKNQVSWMWLYATSPLDPERPDIRIFEYRPGRSGENAEKFLEGFHGILVHDQFSGYNRLAVEHAACWAHMRREFVKGLSPDPRQGGEDILRDPANRKGKAWEAICKIAAIAAEEEKLNGLPPEERKEARLRQEKPLVEDFFVWLESIRPKLLPKFQTAKAVNYSLNAKEPEASAAIHSLVETSKANGFDPEKYLSYVLNKMRGKNFRGNPEMLEGWMPWSEDAQDNCKA